MLMKSPEMRFKSSKNLQKANDKNEMILLTNRGSKTC